MKKWMIRILIAVLAITLSFYLFIPPDITIRKSVIINVSPEAIRRLLIDKNSWSKVVTGTGQGATVKDNSEAALFNGNLYKVVDRKYSSLMLAIYRGIDSIATSSLNIITISKDSTILDWEISINHSDNLLKRMSMYRQAKAIENDIVLLLNKMNAFFLSTENVYGINIRQEHVVDSTLLSTYDSSRGYPTTAFIYSLINKLKEYISAHDAEITGYPMLNIYTKDSTKYIIKVALPVNKKLPGTGNIAYKWMLPGGNILVTEVKGSASVLPALQKIELFMKDYGRQAPAIPFLSLVTDRMQEKDSSGWITRIYYPVME